MKVEIGSGEFGDEAVHLDRVSPAPNVSGRDVGFGYALEKVTSEGFGKEFKTAHFVGTVDTGFAAQCKLFEQLPAESGFASGGSCAYDVVEAGFALRVSFQVVDVGFEVIGEESHSC